MNLTLSTKQVIFLAFGICGLGAVVAITIWAATMDHATPKPVEVSTEAGRSVIVNVRNGDNRSRKPPSAPRSSTSRPPATQKHDVRTESFEAIMSRSDDFDRIDRIDSEPFRPSDNEDMVAESSHRRTVETPNHLNYGTVDPFEQKVDAQTQNRSEWEKEIWNVAGLLRMVSKSVGFDDIQDDEAQQDEDEDEEEGDAESDTTEMHQYETFRNEARSSWAGLAYLGFGTFLLKQMDLLLRQQPEPVDPQLESGRSFDSSSIWRQNALNVLFVDPEKLPSNSTDGAEWNKMAENVVDNENQLSDVEHFDANNYARALLNLVHVVKTENNVALDCIWNLFCHELNKRATLQGVAGAVARMNSVVLEVILRSLPPHRATGKLVTSLLKWQQLECDVLFPTCNEHVALPYLLQLAAINEDQDAETTEASP